MPLDAGLNPMLPNAQCQSLKDVKEGRIVAQVILMYTYMYVCVLVGVHRWIDTDTYTLKFDARELHL
jgi:hypothetical protein